MNARILVKLCASVLLIVLFSVIALNVISLGDDGRFDSENFLGETGDESTQNIVRNAATTVVIGFKIVCISIAIIILIVISMKYMISAPADRADIKKHAVPYVIGAIILFSTTGIISIIQKISTTIKAS